MMRITTAAPMAPAGHISGRCGMIRLSMSHVLALAALAAMALTGCAGVRTAPPPWAESINLAQFAGPRPGFIHIFEGPGGVRLEVEGIEFVEGGRGVLVEERTLVPAAMSETGKPQAMARRVRLVARGTALVLVEDEGTTTVLDISGREWSMPVETSPPVEGSALTCVAFPSGEPVLFGRKRQVLTAECAGEFDEFVLRERRSYAQGLGPIFLSFGEGGSEGGDIAGFRLMEVRQGASREKDCTE